MTRWLDRHLSDRQFQRLSQIDLQWEGNSAMISRPMVAEYLNLTPEQRRDLARFVSDRDTKRSRGTLTPTDEQTFSRQVLAILSEVQRDRWSRLLGPPCPFSIRSNKSMAGNPASRRGFSSQAPAGR
jgi:hypothetical protein